MGAFDTRTMISTAATPPDGLAKPVAAPEPRPLPQAALEAAAEPTATAYSPIVVAGAVRIVEIALIVAVGLAIYAAYVVPSDGVDARYFVRHRRHRRPCHAGVPGRRHLPGAGVPRLREAVHPARLGLVGGVPHRRSARRSSPRSATSSRASGSAASTCVGSSGAARLPARRCSCWCGAGPARAA